MSCPLCVLSILAQWLGAVGLGGVGAAAAIALPGLARLPILGRRRRHRAACLSGGAEKVSCRCEAD